MATEAQFLVLNTFSDVQRLVNDGVEESLNLDYKASPALTRNSPEVNELCKDVSAFANSAGGQIIYGVAEDKTTRKAVLSDPGIVDGKITREWIEQVLNSKIQPRISGIRTTKIDNNAGGSIFVITIPPSQTGPHQAPDKKYYRRFDLQSVAMEDYEIKDVMRRGTVPALQVDLTFASSDRHRVEYAAQQEYSKPFSLVAWISNNSSQPAEYAIIDIGLDRQLSVGLNGGYEKLVIREDDRGIPLSWYRFTVRPPRIPIFKEHKQRLSPNDFSILFHSRLLGVDKLFDFAIQIAAPGFEDVVYWTAHFRGGVLRLYPPTHQFTATR